ncbi:hypothetical protein [Shimia thalassica]|uniref:hypothetical protein n=1 Tax=Shimia thalassica TaxID=1715693 RepID=UPI0026E2C142|nr:hypothetical protein [Shimia thalassica]MDO6485129.1 hypothetical protein [Shimia thalassica]
MTASRPYHQFVRIAAFGKMGSNQTLKHNQVQTHLCQEAYIISTFFVHPFEV